MLSGFVEGVAIASVRVGGCFGWLRALRTASMALPAVVCSSSGSLSRSPSLRTPLAGRRAELGEGHSRRRGGGPVFDRAAPQTKQKTDGSCERVTPATDRSGGPVFGLQRANGNPLRLTLGNNPPVVLRSVDILTQFQMLSENSRTKTGARGICLPQ